MPYRKTNRRKTYRKKPGATTRRKGMNRQKFKFTKGLSRSVIPFIRERETYFNLNDLTGSGTSPFGVSATADGGVAGNLSVKLSDLPNSSDFTNLFRQYKLNYLVLIFYPAANTAQAGDDSAHNNNVLIRISKNQTGIAMGAGNTISEWSQIQAKRQWMLAQNKPTKIKVPLSQLYEVTDGTSTSTAVGRPRYISTNNPGVSHYGLNIRFDSCSGISLSAGEVNVWPQFRIVAKVYLTCKGVA